MGIEILKALGEGYIIACVWFSTVQLIVFVWDGFDKHSAKRKLKKANREIIEEFQKQVEDSKVENKRMLIELDIIDEEDKRIREKDMKLRESLNGGNE